MTGAAAATVAATAAEADAAGGERGSGSGSGGATNSPTGSGDSEATADAVFRDAMRRKGLSVVDVEPDGNCLFRSVSHQIFGDAERHYPVRKACVEHMSRHKARFGVFVAEDFRDYLYRIRQPGVWGDDLEIRWAQPPGGSLLLLFLLLLLSKQASTLGLYANVFFSDVLSCPKTRTEQQWLR